MDDSAAVDIFKRQANLYKEIENLRFAKQIIVFYFPFDVISEIADFAVFHDYY